MKQQFLRSLLLGLLALQGFACAGADAEDTASGAAESAALEVELSAEDIPPEDAPTGEEADAPQSVQLLSPAERAAQLGALRGNAAPNVDAPDVDAPDLVSPLSQVVSRSTVAGLSSGASRPSLRE